MTKFSFFAALVFILFSHFPVNGQIDTDNDGMPDDWEIANGLNIDDPEDAVCDPDADAVRNLYEYQLGTDPYNSQSPQHINVSPSITAAEFKQLLDDRHSGPPTVLRLARGDYDFTTTIQNFEYQGESIKVMIQGGWTDDHLYYDGTTGLECTANINGFDIDKGGPFISEDDFNTFILHSLGVSYDERIQITNGGYPGRISMENIVTYGEDRSQIIINQSGENNRADVLIAFQVVVGASGAFDINQSAGDSLSLKFINCTIAPNLSGLPFSCDLEGPSSLNLEIINSLIGADDAGNSIICRQNGQDLGVVNITVESSRLDDIQRNESTGTTNLINISSNEEDVVGTGKDLGWIIPEGLIGMWGFKTNKPYVLSSIYSDCIPQNGKIFITSLKDNIEFEISLDGANYETQLTGLNAGNYDVWIRSIDGCHHYRTSYTLDQDITNDNDDDGMPNDWENANGLNPCDPADAYCDNDGDQVINLFEYQMQADPNDPMTPQAVQLTQETTQEEYDNLIASALGGSLYIRFAQGKYNLAFNQIDNTQDHRILLQGGWSSDFSYYDPFTQVSRLSGETIAGNDIIVFKSIDGVSWSSFILDGLVLDEGTTRVSLRSASGLSHYSFYNCSFKGSNNSNIETRIRDSGNNQTRLINSTFQNEVEASSIENNLKCVIQTQGTQYVDIINSNLLVDSGSSIFDENIRLDVRSDGQIDLDISNSTLNIYENGDRDSRRSYWVTFDDISSSTVNILNSVFNTVYGSFSDPLLENSNGSFLTLSENSPYKEMGIDLGLAYEGNAPDIGFNAALKTTVNDFGVLVEDTFCDLQNGSISVSYLGYADLNTSPQSYAEYSLDNLSYQSTAFTDLNAGTYELWAKTYRDDCIKYLGEFQINEEELADFESVVEKADCELDNGSITAIPPGDIADFTYSIDGDNYQSSNVFENLGANVYIIYYKSVKDSSCVIQDYTILNQETEIALSLADTVGTSCGNDNGFVSLQVNEAQGESSFYYGGGMPQASPEFQDLPSGDYTFFVEDERACADSITVSIADSQGIAISDTLIKQPTCGLENGQFGILSVDSDVLSLTLNGEEASVSSNDNLAPDSYFVLLTDDAGCTEELNFVLEQSEAIEIKEIDVMNTRCGQDNGFVNILEVLGNPSEYSIDGISYAAQDSIKDLASGDYLLYAKNENCSDTISFNVEESTKPLLSISSFDGTSCGEMNGTLNLDVINGTGPYTYGLDSLENELGFFESLEAGEYVAYVEDLFACQDSTDLTIEDSQAVELSASVLEGLCGELGAISLSANIENQNVYADENGQFENLSMFNNLEGGEYIFYVRTAENCLDTLVVDVPVFDVPEIVLQDKLPAFCEEPVGSLSIIGEGGKGELKFSLDDGIPTVASQFDNLAEDTYIITVTDETGCSNTNEITVESTPRVRIDDLDVEQLYCGDALGELNFTLAGGTGNLSYTLTNSMGQAVDELNGLSEGIYDLTVIDELACEHTEVIRIKKENCTIYVPTIFNPNSPDENKYFKISVSDKSNFLIESFRIFDRWGNLVYNEQDIDPLNFDDWWDGTFNGGDLGEGVYVYTIKVDGEKTELLRGSITLIR